MGSSSSERTHRLFWGGHPVDPRLDPTRALGSRTQPYLSGLGVEPLRRGTFVRSPWGGFYTVYYVLRNSELSLRA